MKSWTNCSEAKIADIEDSANSQAQEEQPKDTFCTKLLNFERNCTEFSTVHQDLTRTTHQLRLLEKAAVWQSFSF
jgi:hypothetical protein